MKWFWLLIVITAFLIPFLFWLLIMFNDFNYQDMTKQDVINLHIDNMTSMFWFIPTIYFLGFLTHYSFNKIINN